MKYADNDYVCDLVDKGRHRQIIGGMWDEMGQLQRDFLIARGLAPHHRVIDIGAGSLRAGVPLTAYLEPHHYYAMDLHEELLVAGLEREIIPANLGDRLGRENLHASDCWDISPFGVQFDFGIAQSVFSHMAIENLADCLKAIAPHFKPGGQFYATYFERPDDYPVEDGYRHETGGITSYSDRDPFDVTQARLKALTVEGWQLEIIGEWGHPRDQRMALFVRAQ